MRAKGNTTYEKVVSGVASEEHPYNDFSQPERVYDTVKVAGETANRGPHRITESRDEEYLYNESSQVERVYNTLYEASRALQLQPTAAASELQNQYMELLPPGVYDNASGAKKMAYGGPLGNTQVEEHPYELSTAERVYEAVYEVPLH